MSNYELIRLFKQPDTEIFIAEIREVRTIRDFFKVYKYEEVYKIYSYSKLIWYYENTRIKIPLALSEYLRKVIEI